MERGFQALLMGGESSDDDYHSPPAPAFVGTTTMNDACITALYSAMNAQTLSLLSDEKCLLQSPEYGYGTSPLPVAPTVDPVACGYGAKDVVEDWKLRLKAPKYETLDYGMVSDVVSTEPPFDFTSESSGSVSGEFQSRLSQLLSGMNSQTSPLTFPSVSDENYLLQSLEKYGYGALPVVDPSVVPLTYGYEVVDHWKLHSAVDYIDEKLKTPIHETIDSELANDASTTEPPFNFMLNTSGTNSTMFDPKLGKLPSLFSLDPINESFGFGLTESPKKRIRSLSPATSSSSYFTSPVVRQIESAPTKATIMARSRRQRISEKTRCLQKLLPWDKKMDQATMLEEAYKYVKFLQAQVSALQSMPVDSSFSLQSAPGSGVNGYGGLWRLNRQQMLQVMVNSPVVQTRLCSKGLCVYSIEQLVRLKEVAERKFLFQQMGWNL